jgi:hypothetical protein
MLAKVKAKKRNEERKWEFVRKALTHGKLSNASLDLAMDLTLEPNNEAAHIWDLQKRKNFVLLKDIEVLPESALKSDGSSNVHANTSEPSSPLGACWSAMGVSKSKALRQNIPAGTYGIMKQFLQRELTGTEAKRIERKKLTHNLEKGNLQGEKRLSRMHLALKTTAAEMADDDSDTRSNFSCSTRITVNSRRSGSKDSVSNLRRSVGAFQDEKFEVDEEPDNRDARITMPVLKLYIFGNEREQLLDGENAKKVSNRDEDDSSSSVDGFDSDGEVATFKSGVYYYPLHPGHDPLCEVFACS